MASLETAKPAVVAPGLFNLFPGRAESAGSAPAPPTPRTLSETPLQAADRPGICTHAVNGRSASRFPHRRFRFRIADIVRRVRAGIRTDEPKSLQLPIQEALRWTQPGRTGVEIEGMRGGLVPRRTRRSIGPNRRGRSKKKRTSTTAAASARIRPGRGDRSTRRLCSLATPQRPRHTFASTPSVRFVAADFRRRRRHIINRSQIFAVPTIRLDSRTFSRGSQTESLAFPPSLMPPV